MHPIIASVFLYYKYYPLIYVFVCAYHVYNYYEYTKVITHFIKLTLGGKKASKPKEEDYEWIFIEEELLEDEDMFFDLHMMVLVTEPELTTDIEGETDTNYTNVDFVEIITVEIITGVDGEEDIMEVDLKVIEDMEEVGHGDDDLHHY